MKSSHETEEATILHELQSENGCTNNYCRLVGGKTTPYFIVKLDCSCGLGDTGAST